MATYPPAIVFISKDFINDIIVSKLTKQLYIDEVIDGYVFDDRVATIPNYSQSVRNMGKRLMVIRLFTETPNRDEADLALFVKNGLASIEKNNFGPPSCGSFAILNLNWKQLGFYEDNHSIL